MALKTLGFRVATLKPRIETTIEPGSWRSGKTTSERGYGFKWQKARADFLKRHPFCRMCEEGGLIIEATVVDHRIPHRGDQALFWDKTNWQSLCAPHHSGEKQRQEQADRVESGLP